MSLMTECAMEGASFRDTLFQVVADVAEQGSCLAMPISGIDQRSKAGDGGRTEKQNFGTISHAACSCAVWACLRSTRCTVAVETRWLLAISRRASSSGFLRLTAPKTPRARTLETGVFPVLKIV